MIILNPPLLSIISMHSQALLCTLIIDDKTQFERHEIMLSSEVLFMHSH